MYILMLSVHGLIRGHDLELGRDPDTGGQTRYVVDLVKALADEPEVGRVDLLTRRIVDAELSQDYAEPLETISERVRIARVDAGPAGYIRKEQLWDHLDSLVDNAHDWLRAQGRWPDVIHSHYADAGYVGVRLANLLGVPLVHTAHSLGRDKRHRLLATGMDGAEIDRRYNMARRVDAEEEVLATADLVITSTRNEIEEQYGLYDHYHPERMVAIPPGADLQRFHPPDDGGPPPAFEAEVDRFLTRPDRPLILALSRADPRKNLGALVCAYGESKRLQDLSNLLIVAGNRDDVRDLVDAAAGVLTELLLLVDAYDLYGRVAMPKHHRPEEVPEIYRLVSASGGVFVNPALTEPFGLTLLEAAASGLPVVATENGGPVDIIANCANGLLIDPVDTAGIAAALEQILTDREQWQRFRANGLDGVREHYSWRAHARRYLRQIRDLPEAHVPVPDSRPVRRALVYRDRALFSDLDQSLVGDPEGVREFSEVIRRNRRRTNFGIATGRRLSSALALMKKHSLPIPDVLITALGTQINYGSSLVTDEHWTEHIDHLWKPGTVRRALAGLPGLNPQAQTEQSRMKVSYLIDPAVAPTVEEIIALLRTRDLAANVIHSFGQYLDVIPLRASKGQALRYVAHRFGIPLEHILVAGGSGADEDMMRGNTLAVIVANRHHEELSQLADAESIYLAERPHALGILEAIEYYDFFGECRAPDSEP